MEWVPLEGFECRSHMNWLLVDISPHTAWLSFIELDKAVVHVIRLAGCL